MFDEDKEREGEERPRIIIEDKRLWHEGDEDDEPAPAPETPAPESPAEEPSDSMPEDPRPEFEPAGGGEELADETPRRSFEVMGEPSPYDGESAGGAAEAAAFDEDAATLHDMLGDATEEDLSDVFRDMTPEDEERLKKAARAQIEGLSKMGIENYLRDAFNVAYILSLQYLGIQPNPATNLTSRDLKRAAICIDVIDFLRQRLADFLSSEERVQLQALVASLKMEFSKIYSPPSPPGK